MKQDRIPSASVISCDPFPASEKIYVQGTMHDIKVAMRKINVGDTVHEKDCKCTKQK